MRESATAKGLALQVEIGTQPKNTLIGDPMRINQILLNLISNAIKFTAQGSIVIAFDKTSAHGAGAQYSFSVSDRGIGIPSEAQEHTFDSFAQADDSTTRQYGGTGLSLSVSRDFAKLMGGELAVDSEPGRGSRFTLTWTLAESDEPLTTDAGTQAPEPTEVDTAGTLDVHVLVADDNQINQSITGEMLTTLGCTCDMVDDGLCCVDQYRSSRYDAVLMDCDMPGLDGCETADRIGLLQRKLQRPPTSTIAVTAHDNDEYRKRPIDAGIAGFVTKPYTLDDLRIALHRVQTQAQGADAPHPGMTSPAHPA